MNDMNTKQFWETKEETLVHILAEMAKEKKGISEYDAGWYGGQLDLVRKILKNLIFTEERIDKLERQVKWILGKLESIENKLDNYIANK